jgi:hypothetical protein
MKRASSAATIRSQASAIEALRAFNRRDHRLRKGAQRFDPFVQVIEHLHLRGWPAAAALEQALQVAAGAELRAGAAQHHAAQRGVGFGNAERFDARRDDLVRQRIARCRVAQGEHEHGIDAFGQEFGGHGVDVQEGAAAAVRKMPQTQAGRALRAGRDCVTRTRAVAPWRVLAEVPSC